MKASGCAYCCGDLMKVDGLLGPEFFCPACRRFQPRTEPRFALRSPAGPREPLGAGDPEPAKQTPKNHTT